MKQALIAIIGIILTLLAYLISKLGVSFTDSLLIVIILILVSIDLNIEMKSEE